MAPTVIGLVGLGAAPALPILAAAIRRMWRGLKSQPADARTPPKKPEPLHGGWLYAQSPY